MRKVLASAALLCLTLPLLAQKIEYSAQVYSGLYRYAGSPTAGNSVVIGGQDNSGSYTGNPYGNKNGVSYGAAVQAQVIKGSHFIIGLQTGYEILRSKVSINTYYPYSNQYVLYSSTAIAPNAIDVTGSTHLQSSYININPYIGYRVSFKKVNVDLLPGIDIGLQTAEPRERGKIKLNDGSEYTTNYSREDQNDTDIRLRFGLAATYKKLGLTASYAHGFSNRYPALYYIQDYPGTPEAEKAHSELIRFGISYRFN